MTVRSRRFVGPQFPTAAGVISNMYTVPADRTAVVRSIRLMNTGGNTDAVNLYINGALFGQYSLPAAAGQRQVVDSGLLVLNPGDVFAMYSQYGSTNVTLSGSLLFGAPS